MSAKNICKISFFSINLLGFIIVCGFFLGAFIIQHKYQITPNLLVRTERIIMLAGGLMFLFNTQFTHNKKHSRKILGTIALLINLLGIIVAGRHVYLQHILGRSALLQSQPINYYTSAVSYHAIISFLHKIWAESPAAAQIGIKIYSLSMASWTLLIFITLALLSLLATVQKK